MDYCAYNAVQLFYKLYIHSRDNILKQCACVFAEWIMPVLTNKRVCFVVESVRITRHTALTNYQLVVSNC